jgi:hypothetical protein
MKMVQGQARVLGAGAETQGYVTGNRARVQGQVYTFNSVLLDIGGHTVIVKNRNQIAVADGDEVVAAGKQKADGMLAYSFANLTRGTRVKYPVKLLYAVGALLIVLGLPLMLLLVGFLLIPIGIYLIVHGTQLSKAEKLVDAAVSGGRSG